MAQLWIVRPQDAHELIHYQSAVGSSIESHGLCTLRYGLRLAHLAFPPRHRVKGMAYFWEFYFLQLTRTDLFVHSRSPVSMDFGRTRPADSSSILGVFFRSAAALVAVGDTNTCLFYPVYHPRIACLDTV